MAAAKYNKPAPNLTPVILLVTAVLAVAAVLVDLPVGVVVWLGVAVTAIAYPAPVMTGTKGVAANEHEERQQEKYRSWLQTRAAMFLGNGVGWRTFMPAAPGNASEAAREIREAFAKAKQAGLPAWKLVIAVALGSIAPILRALMPRLAYLPALGLGLIAAALPLSGDAIERAVLAATELNDAPQAISVPMPWWIHLVSGALLAHTVLVLSARKQALSSEPEVGLVGPGELWSDRRGLFWLVVPVAALGVWLGAEGLSALWDGLPRIATALAGAGGGLLALYALLAKTSRDLGLAQWRKVQAAKNEWEPRFSSALKIKDGDAKAMPRIVDRTEIETENGTVTVDTVDSPAGLLVDGMVKNSPALEASLGGGHSLTVLSSPNVDSKRQPVPGTKHPVRVRLVTWPDGTHPNLLDVNLPEELVRITHECDMTDAMDSIGYARPILLELQQVAVMPEKVAPEDAENEPDDEEETDETDEDGSAEPAKPARKKGGALKRIGRFLTGAPEPEPVYPASAPCAVWMTTWAFPEGPSYEGLRTESDAVAKMASRGSDGVDVVVDHRKGFVLIGDPVADDVEYIPESGLEPEYVRQRLTEKLWERRWETTLQHGANPPTVRFEVTRDAELPSRFGGGAVIHEQLFACREGLSASETYIDPVKPLERGMAASLSGAPFVSIVGWPASPRQYGTRHSLLFLVRWSESQVPERPQEVAPAERSRGIDTDASSWVIAHLVNQAFTAKAVKLPKPEISAAECLTMPASPRHVWKVRLSLYGATTLADIRKKADSIQAQLGAPWLRVREDEDGEVWLYMGDPSSSAKFRRGGENEIANLDFEQAWLDSSVKNRSGRTPQLVKMEPLKTNPDISVLDFSFPPGLDFQRVKSAREQLRANFRAEFVDVVPIGSTGVKMFMAKEDPLPKMAGVPWDDLPSTNIAFGVNALGEQVFFDIEDSPHLLILGSSGAGKSVTMRTILFGAILNGFDVVVIDPTKGGLDFAFAKPWSISPFGEEVYGAASIIRAVYGEVEKRKALNKKHGATKIDELPAEVRPHRIMVMIDEFTSLLGSSPVPPKSDDPEVAAARDEVIAENGARAQVGTMAGKIAREARSVGVHLVLGTQKLTAKTLDSIPGAGDLRALALDTRIPVPISDKFPEGWAVNADLEVGDKVYAKGGDIASVVKLTETFENRDTYRIRFDDGQEFVVDAGHLWNASDATSRKAHHSGRAVKVNRVESDVLPRLREIAEKTPYGTVATAEELSEMSGIALTKAKKIIRDLSIPSFVASTDRSVTVPAPVKVGATPRLFSTCEASELYGVDMQSLGEFATSRAIAEFVLGSSSKSDGGVFGTKMLSHGISPLDVDDLRMFDVQEFAHRAADFLENESRGYSLPLYRTVTTEEMHENPGRWAVALSPILGEEAHLPVDPYVLGAWLGDGSTGTGIISSATVPACTSADGITDQQRMIDHLTEAGFEGHALECSPVFVGTRGLKVKLREAGVLDRKHIPAEYLRASYDQRLALLQGLMDTDGSVNANGRCIITQAREHLALEILELVRSLGWDAHYWYGYYGGSHRYQVGFKADRPVFRLPRKVEKQDLSERTPYRMIESIEKIDSTPVRCIGIDHPSHEFLVGEFVPTHNTNLARMALGSTTQGDRMSAFRNPMEADDIGEPRKGRGLYEGLNYVKPTVFHSWYAPERDFPAQLEAAGIGKPTEDRIIDPEDRRFKVAPPEPFVEIEQEDDAPTIEDDVVELDLDLGLDDLDLGDLDLDGESGGIDSADAEEPEGPGDAEPARVVASQMEGESAYEKIDALGGALLDGKKVSALVWDEGGLDEPTEMGATVGELLDELRSDHGIDVEIVGGEAEPEIDDADPEPEPEPDPELDDADPEPETELEIDSGDPEPTDGPDPESTDEPESSLDFEAPPATEVSDSFSFEPDLGESEDDDFGFEAPVIIR